MLRAIIIEDEEHAANLLENMIQDIEFTVEVMDKCHDLPTGVRSIKRNNPDLVFLDIELPVYSGLQLLDFFNSEEITFNVIFTTASNEYAVRAFEMSAIDYLIKPIQIEKLKVAIEKVVIKQSTKRRDFLPILKENFKSESNKKIVVPVSDGYEILELKNIYYFKAEGSYTKIFFANNTSMLISKNLKHIEFILSENHGFFRIHRSFIANLNFARKILRNDGGTLLLENKIELPISDEKMNKVLGFLHNI